MVLMAEIIKSSVTKIINKTVLKLEPMTGIIKSSVAKSISRRNSNWY